MGDGDAPQPLNVEQFRARVRVILRKADLNTITAKAVRVQIQEENDVDLSVHDVKKKFDALVMEVLNEVTGADDDDDDDNGSTAQKGNKDVAVKKEETSTPARQEARVHDSRWVATKESGPVSIGPVPHIWLTITFLSRFLSSKTSRPVPMSSAPSSIGGPGRKKEIKSEEFVHDSDSDGEGPRRSTNYNARNLTDEELARQLQEEESALRSRPGKRKAAPVSSSGSKRAKVEGGKKRGGGGFQRPWVLSEALSAVCGGAKELSRGQAVKQLWTYIKENGLQDPNHKKTIICDDQLKTLFGGKKKVDSFGMMKLLSSHMWKSEDDGGKVVESSEDEDDESLAESEESNPPKKSKASSSKAAASSSATKAKKAKGAAAGGGGGGGGWNAALLLSPALREVVEEA